MKYLSFQKKSLLFFIYSSLLLVIAFVHFQKFPIPAFFHKITSIGVVIFFFAAAYLLGQISLSRLFTKRKPFDESCINDGIALSFGLGLLGTFIFIFGRFIPGPLTMKLTGLTISLGLFILFQWDRLRDALSRLKSEFTGSYSPLDVFLYFLTGSALLTSLLACFSPITYYDSLVYHLGLPAIYNLNQTISGVPFNLYSYFPALTEMLFLFFMNQMPQAESAINLTTWFISLCIGISLYLWISEKLSKSYGLLAATLWFTAPMVLLLSLGAYVDIPLAFFTFFALRAFLKSKDSKWNLSWLLVSGFLCGFACSVKYTGAITPMLLLFYLLLSRFQKRSAIPLRRLAIFCIAVVLPFSPWLIRNAVEIGNPFFPFFYNYFDSSVGWTSETASSYFKMLTEYGHQSNMVLEVLLSPWLILSDSFRFGGGIDVLGDFGWSLFIVLTPLALLFNRKMATLKFLYFYLIFHFVFWFTTKPVLRFLIGGLPIFVFLSTYAIKFIRSKSKISGKIVLPLFIGFFVVSNFFIYSTINAEIQPFRVSLGLEKREDYLSRRLGFYDVYQFANQNLKKTDKILILGEQRGFHLRIPFVTSNIFAPSSLAKVCNNARSVEDIASWYLSQEITHLLISHSEIRRLGGLPKFGFSVEGTANLTKFIENHSQGLAKKGEIELLVLL